MPTILPGRFNWHELLSSDPAAAHGFYEAVVGWGTAPWGTEGYTMWMNGQTPVGGVLELPAELKATGVPPHWLTYISTPDVEATARRAEQMGGKILKPVEVVPTVGRFIVVADPQGAVFCLYQPDNDMAPDTMPVSGGWSWHELATTDREGAFKFYSGLFGWVKTGDMDMGEAGIYQMYGLGEIPMGGIYTKPKEVPVSNWLPYAMVPDADQATATAKKQGATILFGPMEVPGGDRVAMMMDPQGAAFAVHSKKPA
jgi:predicted enzyme related to lactoylglutathione lyase